MNVATGQWSDASAALLLTRAPFLFSHDAASGYLGDSLVHAWAKTQSADFVGQLDCGARAFDARPMLLSTSARTRTTPAASLVWHHGKVAINYKFEASLADIVGWLSHHPEELVLLNIWDCVGGLACMASVSDALAAANVTEIMDCSKLRTLTVSAARQLAAMPSGGSLLAITGPSALAAGGGACSIGNYDASIACTGFREDEEHEARGMDGSQVASGRPTYGCWRSDSTRGYPIGRMLGQVDRVVAKGLNDGFFTQAQALWQETAASVVVGAVRNSSLVLDERRSGLNALLAAEAAKGRWQHNVSLFEVNDVCDHGVELARALSWQPLSGTLLQTNTKVHGHV